jgi:hypothetical protein
MVSTSPIRGLHQLPPELLHKIYAYIPPIFMDENTYAPLLVSKYLNAAAISCTLLWSDIVMTCDTFFLPITTNRIKLWLSRSGESRAIRFRVEQARAASVFNISVPPVARANIELLRQSSARLETLAFQVCQGGLADILLAAISESATKLKHLIIDIPSNGLTDTFILQVRLLTSV